MNYKFLVAIILGPLIVCIAQAQNDSNSVVSNFEQQFIKARPLPLSSVRLTGGPLKAAQDADARFLLSVDLNRAMAALHEAAGLPASAQPFNGWDGAVGRRLTGHIAGHLLSATSLMYAATGDARFKQVADTLVVELAAVQDAHGDGYIGAQQDAEGTPGKEIFKRLSKGEIRRTGRIPREDLNGMWAPWYVEHKILAGLRDAYRFTDNQVALEVAKKLTGWIEQTLAPLDDAQIQEMLLSEFGGMNEVLVDLYADTGDRRWLDLSYKFEHRAFSEPLARGEDTLGNTHGNHSIPKMMGSADRFGYTGRTEDLSAAAFFWNAVVNHHTFATGGNSAALYGEQFPEADRLAAAVRDAPGNMTNESCNIYNMLKLTRRLFSFRPDPHYADYLERALFNHVLAHINPDNGSMSYHVSVGQGVQHDYQDRQGELNGIYSCCVGTGMESHALHGDGIYYESGNQLWVNLYAPTTTYWASAGAQLTMETNLPEGESATLTMTLESPRELTLALRRPFWTTDKFGISVNGEPIAATPPATASTTNSEVSSYIEITRTWKTGDIVRLTIPKTLRLEPTPDDQNLVALMWGPLVLGQDMGPASTGGRRRRGRDAESDPNQPVLVVPTRKVSDWLKPVDGRSGEFRTDGVGRVATAADVAAELSFIPLYRLHGRRYSVYMDLFTPAEWSKRLKMAVPEERRRRLEAATINYIQPGQVQSERQFNYQSSVERETVNIDGRKGRGGPGWFSFDIPVNSTHPMSLVVTFNNDEQANTGFIIMVDDTMIGVKPLESTSKGFFDIEYSIPPNVVRGKEKITVRFEARWNRRIGTVFGIRVIRSDVKSGAGM